MSHSPAPKGTHVSVRVISSLAASWLIFFSLGIYGFHLHGEHGADLWFKTLQLFHMHYPHDYHGASSWPLEIARFGAGLWALAFVPFMLVWLFEERIFRWWVRLAWRGHAIVCGHGSRTLSLIRDLNAHGQRVVFIGHCSGPRSELPARVLYLEGNAQDGHLLHDAAVARASCLVALNEDDQANLEILVVSGKLCAKRSRKRGPLDCHAHLQDTQLQSVLYRALGDTLTDSALVRHHLFNYYEIVARSLACRYPLPEALVESSPLPEHYIIVGFGSFGQNVALKLVKMGQQLVHQSGAGGGDDWRVVKPRVTIVDPRGEMAVASFLQARPAFQDQCDFTFVTASCESSEFLGLKFLMPADAPAKTSIIFCLENETLALRTALQMQEICRSQLCDRDVDAIYLRIAQPEKLGKIIHHIQAMTGKPRLTFCAPDSEVFSADAILRQSLDTLARAVHDSWLKIETADRRASNMPTAAGNPWEKLSEQDRDSNREAADHTWAKLRTLGYELTPVSGDDIAPTLNAELLSELQSREDDLARVEHYRWMTWRILDGWRWGEKRDNEKKLHPDIEPYEKLAPSTQEKDKIIIRAIPKLLSAGRLQAVKGRP